MFSALDFVLGWEKEGANHFSTEKFLQNGAITAWPNKRAATSCCHHLGGPYLGLHPTGAKSTFDVSSHGLNLRSNAGHSINRTGLRIRKGVAGIETIDISETDKHIGLNEISDQSSQCIIISEPKLFTGNRIIFVDNGNGPKT
jgi:hypothetical protein